MQTRVLAFVLAGGEGTRLYPLTAEHSKPYEERGYWRDVGTLGAYAAAQQDLRGSFPRFDLANPEWPIGPGKPRPVTRSPASQIQAFDATLPGEYGAGTAP